MDDVARATTVEIELHILERLRNLHPGKSDREVIEHVARNDLRRATLRQTQERNGLSEDEALELGANATSEVRRGLS